jgi:hypothetical protein
MKTKSVIAAEAAGTLERIVGKAVNTAWRHLPAEERRQLRIRMRRSPWVAMGVCA